MKKTIDFPKEELELIKAHMEENKIKTFSEGVRSIISKKEKHCQCQSDHVTDTNLTLISELLIKLNEKVDLLLTHMAPKSAGNVK
jgi:intein-encoded DNA endonuclease-like protein